MDVAVCPAAICSDHQRVLGKALSVAATSHSPLAVSREAAQKMNFSFRSSSGAGGGDSLTITVDGCKVPVQSFPPGPRSGHGTATADDQQNNPSVRVLNLSNLLDDRKCKRKDLEGVALRCVKSKAIFAPYYSFGRTSSEIRHSRKRHQESAKKRRNKDRKKKAIRLIAVPVDAVLETVVIGLS
jgi:hypothetical protein